jgi:tetratricopeptide (TPR) repeat protein
VRRPTTKDLSKFSRAALEFCKPLKWDAAYARVSVTELHLPQTLAECVHALRTGQLDSARRGFHALTECFPNERAAWSGLGRAAHALGDLRAAVSAWRELSLLEPTSWQILSDLGSTWTEMRDFESAEAAFTQAEALSPDEPLLQLNRATLELRSGQMSEALARLERAVARWPDSAAAQASLGLALRDAGRAAHGVLPLERATLLSPDTALYACGLGRALLDSGDAERALSTAQAYLQRRPGHSGARALEALSRMALGDEAGAAHLLDHSRLVVSSTAITPKGYSDLAAFNAALALHAQNHPSLLHSPLSHATLQGLHSGSLLVEPRGPIAALENAVGAAAGAYVQKLSAAFADHPVLQHRPRSVFLRMWCVVLTRGGHQIPHIHPEAWLSGVYYPKLPPALGNGADGPSDEGSLEFGEPDAPFPSRMAAATFRVRPEQGKLVLFPSYFYHRTLPFESEGTRISIAFDFVPLA